MTTDPTILSNYFAFAVTARAAVNVWPDVRVTGLDVEMYRFKNNTVMVKLTASMLVWELCDGNLAMNQTEDHMEICYYFYRNKLEVEIVKIVYLRSIYPMRKLFKT